jgi:alpha-glucosidase
MLRPSAASGFLLLLVGGALAGGKGVYRRENETFTNSFNVSSCPGYSLHSLSQQQNGLIAKLTLAGPACNAFGTDIAELTIRVTYETESR